MANWELNAAAVRDYILRCNHGWMGGAVTVGELYDDTEWQEAWARGLKKDLEGVDLIPVYQNGCVIGTEKKGQTEAATRKAQPVATGVIDYFPDALVAISELSRIGNDQHNPGKPLHWDRSKSGDESDALMRHFIDRGTMDTDGVRHSAKVAWRALALLQKEIEGEADGDL